MGVVLRSSPDTARLLVTGVRVRQENS